MTQTIFAGDTDPLVLAQVPDGWPIERFSLQAGYLAHAVSPQDTGRPEVSVGNGLIVMRDLAEAITDDLDAVTAGSDTNRSALGLTLDPEERPVLSSGVRRNSSTCSASSDAGRSWSKRG